MGSGDGAEVPARMAGSQNGGAQAEEGSACEAERARARAGAAREVRTEEARERARREREAWLRALREREAHSGRAQRGTMDVRAKKGMGPNKACGHKGGISRQGSKRG